MAVRLPAAVGETDTRRRPAAQLLDEDVAQGVCVACDEVGSERLVGDDAAVGADASELAAIVRFRAFESQANSRRCAGHNIAQEDIHLVVRVLRHQIVGSRVEDHIAAIVARIAVEAVVVPFGSVAADTRAHRCSQRPIPQEHVVAQVVIVRREAARERAEDDVPPVAGDPPRARAQASARAVALHTLAGDADPFRRAGLEIAHEHVPVPVRIAFDKVVSQRGKGYITSIAARRWCEAVAVRL